MGRHVLAELVANGHEPIGMDMGPACPGLDAAHYIPVNITDAASLASLIGAVAPDACIHLAGLAFVGGGDAQMILNVNLVGATNLLEAFRSNRLPSRILFVSSAHVYGMKARLAPIREEDPLAPDTFYAIAKMAADQICLLYAKQYGMDILVARPHNHIGPGQSPQFAISSFARQVNAIRRGAPAVMRVGNLDNHRDFTDVRDIAKAYRLLLEKGHSGQPYNIASGCEVRIGEILDILCKQAGVRPDIIRDEALYRPLDQNPVLDTRRLREDTGWWPSIPLEQTLNDILANS